MAVIIAGGAGFIGVNFVNRILNYDDEIYIVDNFSAGSRKWIKYFNLENKVLIYDCDLSDINQTNNTFENIHSKLLSSPKLWHFAANSDIPNGVKNPQIDFKDTFLTTYNLLQICKKYEILSFYFASSSAVYGDHGNNIINESTGPLMPISNYGAMKLASEAICFASLESFLKDLRIYRFPNVVGMPATHGVILDFVNKLIKNPKVLDVLGNGSQKKSYLHVEDLIHGMIFLAQRDLKNDENPIFNLGPNNDYVTVQWIAEQTVNIVSKSANIIYGEHDRGWLGDVPRFTYDTRKSNLAGWQPKLNSKESILKAIKEISQYHIKNL